jgi:hypothetical protein
LMVRPVSVTFELYVLAISSTPAIILFFAAVAQLDRVLGYEPRGRGFNSCQPHQNSYLKIKGPG